MGGMTITIYRDFPQQIGLSPSYNFISSPEINDLLHEDGALPNAMDINCNTPIIQQ